MADYKAPLRDMHFILSDLFDMNTFWASMPETQEVTLDLVTAILEEGAKITENLLHPLNRSGDEEGCQLSNGQVTTPKGFKEAFKTFAEGGWVGLGGSPEFGGQGMPKVVTVLFEEMLFASNTSFALYPILGSGATLAILKHGSEEIKQAYLQNMYEGKWAGTMCLTEPHCGTDLGLLRTKAESQADGSYLITGNKIFITGGDHDLTDNVVHLVLARLPNAPSGVKGISLFIVPKFLVNSDGSCGQRNGVSVGSIEHKMGIKGSATCVMNFDNAQGWLVGELGKGLNAMFTMMNYERLSIGVQGVGASDAAYQSALAYAKDRIQGRSPIGAVAKDKAADPIIGHPDIRRTLLTIRSTLEAGRAFAVYVAKQLDVSKYHPDAVEREKAELIVALLTPVAKAFFSDRGLENCVMAQQVFGGHGYIREWGMEQHVRDVRIAQIYEGANGIQALDLVSRKIVKSNGAMLEPFIKDVEGCVNAHINGELSALAKQLQLAVGRLKELTTWLVQESVRDAALPGASSVEYLDIVGYVTYAFMWLKMAAVAKEKISAGETEALYYQKLQLATFYFDRVLPRYIGLIESVRAGSSAMMSIDAESF